MNRISKGELKRIIRNVLLENYLAEENINPKNLKIGSGGKYNPNQRKDVSDLQQKLIDLKLLKTKSGKPTGYFGPLTQAALNAYNKNQPKTPTTPTPPTGSAGASLSKGIKQPQSVVPAGTMAPKSTSVTPELSWGEKLWNQTKDVCTRMSTRAREFTVGFQENLISPLSPHLRAFMFFLEGRKLPITEEFFDNEEMDSIRSTIETKFPRTAQCRKNKSCMMSFYHDVNWAELKKGNEKQINISLDKSIGFTLGNAKVEDKGSYYEVTDIYDFNNYKNDPSAYTFANAPKTIKNALSKLFCGNFVQGVEELASYKQALGYEGIPVKIRVDKSQVS